MMKLNKILSVALAVTMVSGMLYGCGSSEKPAENTSTQAPAAVEGEADKPEGSSADSNSEEAVKPRTLTFATQ